MDRFTYATSLRRSDNVELQKTLSSPGGGDRQGLTTGEHSAMDEEGSRCTDYRMGSPGSPQRKGAGNKVGLRPLAVCMLQPPASLLSVLHLIPSHLPSPGSSTLSSLLISSSSS